MWFSYEQNSMTNMFPLDAEKVKEIIKLNRRGIKVANVNEKKAEKSPEFMSAVGEDSISRFDEKNNDRHRHPKRGKPSRNNRKRGENDSNQQKS
jgi:hypothetical protein